MPNLRTRAAEIIATEQVTFDDLVSRLETTPKSLNAVFAQLRLQGKYPVRKEDGFFVVLTEAEYEAEKERRQEVARQKKEAASRLTPEEQEARYTRMIEKARARVASTEKTYGRWDSEPNADKEQGLFLKYEMQRLAAAHATARLDYLLFAGNSGVMEEDDE